MLGSRGLQLLGSVVKARDCLGLGEGSASSGTFIVIVLFLLWVADAICLASCIRRAGYIFIGRQNGHRHWLRQFEGKFGDSALLARSSLIGDREQHLGRWAAGCGVLSRLCIVVVARARWLIDLIR